MAQSDKINTSWLSRLLLRMYWICFFKYSLILKMVSWGRYYFPSFWTYKINFKKCFVNSFFPNYTLTTTRRVNFFIYKPGYKRGRKVKCVQATQDSKLSPDSSAIAPMLLMQWILPFLCYSGFQRKLSLGADHTKEVVTPIVNFEKVGEVKISLAESKCLINLN